MLVSQKYKERIFKEIEDIKKMKFVQVVSSLNLSLIIEPYLKSTYKNSVKKEIDKCKSFAR